MTRADAFRVLGLPYGEVDPERVRSAWRAYARRWHPDRGGTAEKFTEGRQAYELLLGPEYVSPIEPPRGPVQRDSIRVAVNVARQVANTPGVHPDVADVLSVGADIIEALLRKR